MGSIGPCPNAAINKGLLVNLNTNWPQFVVFIVRISNVSNCRVELAIVDRRITSYKCRIQESSLPWHRCSPGLS